MGPRFHTLMPEPGNVTKYHIMLCYVAELTLKRGDHPDGSMWSHRPIKAENVL